MSKFKVDSEQIDATVETLKTLLTKCEELYDKEIPVSDVDKGQTHEELISVCDNIRTTCYYFGQLIHNTIEFLGKSSEMFEESDKNSATAIAAEISNGSTQPHHTGNNHAPSYGGAADVAATGTKQPQHTGINHNDYSANQHESSQVFVDVSDYSEKATDTEYARLCSWTNKLFDNKNPTAEEFITAIKNDSYFSDKDPLKNISTDQITVISEGSGFGAIVIEDGESAVVIFSGTNMASKDIGDIATDGSVLLGTWNYQGKQAIDLVNGLSEKYDNIVVAGHSLGGYLATASTLKNDAVSKCITFDAPGRYDAVLQKSFNSGRTSVITSYEARGSTISSVGYDVGDVHRIPVGNSGTNFVDRNHSIDKLFESMNEKTPMKNSWI